MGFSPLENLRNLVPVAHFLERQMLYWRPRNNHAIELLVTHRGEIFIKAHHVCYGRVLRRMTSQLHKAHLQL